MLTDEPRSVVDPGTNTWVAGYDLYHEAGPHDLLSGYVAPSLSQYLFLYLLRVATFGVRDVRRSHTPP